jgi:hypothetical protein
MAGLVAVGQWFWHGHVLCYVLRLSVTASDLAAESFPTGTLPAVELLNTFLLFPNGELIDFPSLREGRKAYASVSCFDPAFLWPVALAWIYG